MKFIKPMYRKERHVVYAHLNDYDCPERVYYTEKDANKEIQRLKEWSEQNNAKIMVFPPETNWDDPSDQTTYHTVQIWV